MSKKHRAPTGAPHGAPQGAPPVHQRDFATVKVEIDWKQRVVTMAQDRPLELPAVVTLPIAELKAVAAAILTREAVGEAQQRSAIVKPDLVIGS